MDMPQYKVVYPSQQPLRRIMPSVCQQINQSVLLVPEMETSQHNAYESESLGSMNVNEVTMPQYKPSSQKSTISEWSMSQCRILSRATVSPIKVHSKMAMP